MNNKNKSLSLLMATATVATLGVGSAVTSFGAYTQSEADNKIQELTGLVNAVTNLVAATDISYETLLSWIGDTDDTSNISQGDKSKIISWLNTNKLAYETDEKGSISSITVGSKKYTRSEIFTLLKEGKDYIKPNPTGGGSDGFVVTSGSGSGSSSGSSSGSGSGSSSGSSSSSTQTKSDTVVETTSTVTAQYKMDEILTSTQVDFGQMVESLKNAKEDTAVTLDVGNAKWIIEKKGLDMTKAANFSFNPAVATTEVSHAVGVIPEEVKKVAEGKSNVVINFTEKQVVDTKKNQELPFNAKVAVTVGSQYANKKMKVYYIVNGKSYNLGSVVIDKNGRVICNFKVIGDFVLVEDTPSVDATAKPESDKNMLVTK
ncbi:MAG: hypothetical protein J6C55_03420 [Oscillospiraceae bacterium]|nr:hypothetical protein [Oscillospiraceae bacterium]